MLFQQFFRVSSARPEPTLYNFDRAGGVTVDTLMGELPRTHDRRMSYARNLTRHRDMRAEELDPTRIGTAIPPW